MPSAAPMNCLRGLPGIAPQLAGAFHHPPEGVRFCPSAACVTNDADRELDPGALLPRGADPKEFKTIGDHCSFVSHMLASYFPYVGLSLFRPPDSLIPEHCEFAIDFELLADCEHCAKKKVLSSPASFSKVSSSPMAKCISAMSASVGSDSFFWSAARRLFASHAIPSNGL